MIIMFLGDTHGSKGFTKQAIDIAKNVGVDRLVQVGDFGYWPRSNGGQKFLGEIGRHAVKRMLPFYWITGNHEDHDTLDENLAHAIECGTIDADPTVSPFWHGKRITHIRSGARWEWGGVWFGALGGAFSIDRKFRTKHVGWFPQEIPDPSLIPGLGKVDVLVTHEAPTVPPLIRASGNFWTIEESATSQETILAALNATRPDYLVHGHWHLNYRNIVNGVHVVGLNCDMTVMDAACVYDTEHRIMYSLNQWVYLQEENREESSD